MISELNANFMTELGSATVAEQFAATVDTELDNPFSQTKFIFVGGSHAGRLAGAADNAGINAANLSQPGFRVTAENIENLAILLRDEIEKDIDMRQIGIFKLYDNNSFFSVMDDGSKTLPVCDQYGLYHMLGRLEVAEHSIIKNLVNNSVPLLRAARDCEKVILSPLPRYLKKCCNKEMHLINRKEPGFKQMLEEGLGKLSHSLQELIHGKKIRAFKVLSPLGLVGDLDQETKIRFWDTDPVHLTPAGYSELARAITEAAVHGDFDRQPKKNAAQAARVTAAMRQNFKRQSWIYSDDNTAHRVYSSLPQGVFRGPIRGGHHGGQKFFGGGLGGRGPYRGRGTARGFHRGTGGRGGIQRSWPY
jgi:hypothetical protein